MTVTDQVIAQAQQLAGDSQDSELLNLLCRAAVSSLAAQLRGGLHPGKLPGRISSLPPACML